MPFAKGVLAGRVDLSGASQLLHALCFDRVELETPKLSYEPRWSCQCKDCAAVWIASKSGDVMRIDLSTDPPRQRWLVFRGYHEARTVYHLHDGAALGGGAFLFVGRDDGTLDVIPDRSEAWADQPPPARRGASGGFHLDSWSAHPDERDAGAGFERMPGDPMGITAIAVLPWPGPVNTLDILIATRRPSLHIVEATRGQVRIRPPRRMPGWIQWIIGPPDDEHVTCISRGGDILRLTRDELSSGHEVQPTTLSLLPTAALPFDGGLLLGTTKGLFLVREDRSEVAVPVTRSPVLCLDRARVGTEGGDSDQHDYVTMGLEDGRLRIIDSELLLALANGAPRPRAHDHNFVKELGDAVLAVETVQPSVGPPHTAYVLTVQRDHSVRLFHVTSQQRQREAALRLWDACDGAPAMTFTTELEAARACFANHRDNSWKYMLVDVVLPRLCGLVPAEDAARRDAHYRIVELACAIAEGPDPLHALAPGQPVRGTPAGRPVPEPPTDRFVLHRLSTQLAQLTGGDVGLELELSCSILRAVPRGNDQPRTRAQWDAFIDSHLRELNTIARGASAEDLERLVAWARFVRKFILLGHTFAAKRLRLGELVEQNYEIRKYLDALIYQTRLLQRRYDLHWATRIAEQVAELHSVDCGRGRALVVLVMVDGQLAFIDGTTGRRLEVAGGSKSDVVTPIRDGGSARTLACAVGLRDDVVVSRDATEFRIVLACDGRDAPEPSGLAVFDLRWSAFNPEVVELIASVTSIACDDDRRDPADEHTQPDPRADSRRGGEGRTRVHAVQHLPRWRDAFVVGLETAAAPVGLLWRNPRDAVWRLELARGTEPTDPPEGEGPAKSSRHSLAPGKLPTRALAAEFDDRESRYVVVAGSNDGLVRAISFARNDRPRKWKVKPWDRMADAVVSIALVRSSDRDDSRFACYLGTDTGDTFALSILARQQREASTTVLPFGDYDAQALWRDTHEAPVLAVRLWPTELYKANEILVVATEDGRLCIYNHASGKHEVSAAYNYYFRGLRLDRLTMPGRLRALTRIGNDRFVAAGPGELYMAEIVYPRNSRDRPIPAWRRTHGPSSEPRRPHEPGDDRGRVALEHGPHTRVEPALRTPERQPPLAQPPLAQPPLADDIWTRLGQLFEASRIDEPFKLSPGKRGELKFALCDLVRLDGGALSAYLLRVGCPPEHWHRLHDDNLRDAARRLLDRLDPENPEDAERIKIIIKSLCRAFLFCDPHKLRTELLAAGDSVPDWHAQTAVVCQIAADYLKDKLGHSTSAVARLRIVVIKELLRVRTLRHMARGEHSDRIRITVGSALDACLHDDHRLVRIEAMRALSVVLRNVGIMADFVPDEHIPINGHETGDREAIIKVLFPQGLDSLDWILRPTVGGLLRFPSFTPRTALVSGAWHLIWALLPLFHIFRNHTLALCDYLVRAGLGVEVLDMCRRSLRGQTMAAIRSRIVHLYLVPAAQSRDEFYRCYRCSDTASPKHQELVEAMDLPPRAEPAITPYWHELDDRIMADRLIQLLDRCAGMWNVRNHEDMTQAVAGFRIATAARNAAPACDAPLAALERTVEELASVAARLANANADDAGDLDRLRTMFSQPAGSSLEGPRLTAPLQAIASSIVEAWRKIYKPSVKEGSKLSTGYTLGPEIERCRDEFRRVFHLTLPARRKDEYVIKILQQSAAPDAARRFLRGARINQALWQKSPHLVEVIDVLDDPDQAYVLYNYRKSLEDCLTMDFHCRPDALDGFDALRCAEWVATQIGNALVAVHFAGRYHGDVKPSNILIRERDNIPTFHLGDFYLADAPETQHPAGPVSIVPGCLSRRCQDHNRLHQWHDVAALSLTVYRMLTGEFLDPCTTKNLRNQVRWLRDMAGDERTADRPGSRRVIATVMRVFADDALIDIQQFMDSLAQPEAAVEHDAQPADRDITQLSPLRERRVAAPTPAAQPAPSIHDTIGSKPTRANEREYDVVLSFAGPDRTYAESLAAVLGQRRLRVFYDAYEEATLWGKNLYDHLAYVYGRSAYFCVIYVSHSYAEQLWTNHERRAAQARAFEEHEEYILPIRLDDTDIPGLPKTIAYLDANKTPEQIAEILVQKLARRASTALPGTAR